MMISIRNFYSVDKNNHTKNKRHTTCIINKHDAKRAHPECEWTALDIKACEASAQIKFCEYAMDADDDGDGKRNN